MAHCFTPIRGRRLRVTKVNALGRPVYGPNAYVVTGGFVSVQFSPQIQEGEEITVRTADGSLCVSERGCDELQWIEVQIEFCQVDPCLFTLINETWTELRDCVGEVIGWAESYKLSCDSGFALELFTDVTGYTPTTPGATSAYGYMLLPFVVGATLGEQTVENGAVSFTITGRTKKGSGWGVGPYDVMCNDPVTGACGPLLTPVGPDEPRRIFLTTCPPPPAVCGCQPLSAPDGPVVLVTEVDPGVGQPRRQVSVQIPAGTVGTFRMSWGDASPAQDIAAGAVLTHTYDRDGTYAISVWDVASPQKITVHTVTVPFTGGIIPAFTVAQEGADTRNARASVTNAMAGRTYEVQWKAGGVWEDMTGTPPAATNQYVVGDDGDVVVTVRDKFEPTKSASRTVAIPFVPVVQPVLLATEERGTPETNRRTTRVTVTNPQVGANYEISWNNGTSYTAMALNSSDKPSATQVDAASLSSLPVIVRQVGTPSNSTSVAVPLPHPGPTFEMVRGATDNEVSLTVDNPGAATFEAEWVSGTWTPLTTGAGTHTYASDDTYRVRVRDAATPATVASQQVSVPLSTLLALAADAEAENAAPAEGTTARKRK